MILSLGKGSEFSDTERTNLDFAISEENVFCGNTLVNNQKQLIKKSENLHELNTLKNVIIEDTSEIKSNQNQNSKYIN